MLIRNNYYLLLLIEEVLARIYRSKYYTRLNIVLIFNKLQMN